MGPGAVVVREVASQEVAQMALAQDEGMIETLSPYRADEPFREGILPGASGGREALRNLSRATVLLYTTSW